MSGEHGELTLDKFSPEEISTSGNSRLKELTEKYSDQSLLDRINSYVESHDKYEKSSTW
ncbi:MAG: hypothetical protein ACOC6D_07705 [Atribacterota bacterium]